MKFFKKAKKAFTLVELVVVIAIIAILSGVSVAVYVGITKNARVSKAQSEATSIGTVVRAAVMAGDLAGGPLVYKNSTDEAKLTFSVEGLHVEVVTGFAQFTLNEASAIIAKVYADSEGAAYKGSITAAELDTATFSSDKKAVIESFTYKPDGNNADETAKYNFKA